MPLGRNLRKSISIGLIGMLLLMQCLVVAHACALALPAPADLHAGCTDRHPALVTAALVTADESPAPGQDSALCKAHCSNDPSLPAAQADGSPPAPNLGWFLVVAMPALPAAWLPAPAAQGLPTSGGAPPGWPPLYLQHQVLRN